MLESVNGGRTYTIRGSTGADLYLVLLDLETLLSPRTTCHSNLKGGSLPVVKGSTSPPLELRSWDAFLRGA